MPSNRVPPHQIADASDLAFQLGLSRRLVYLLTVRTEHFYYTFTIPKRRGGTRQIDAPYDALKGVQAWILRYILEPVALPPVATAFRRRKNLRDNVVPHQGHQFILCIDLEDFFPSIGANKVFSVFRSLGYTNFVSHLLTSLCTYRDRLPQGGVTSPILSNITCKRLDNRFSGYASRLFVSYTRYADDLTFSSNEPANLRKMLRFARRILPEEGFSLNESKTRFLGNRMPHLITGLIIGSQGVGIGANRKRLVRDLIYNQLKASVQQTGSPELSNQIRGWFSLLNAVDKRAYDQLRNFTNNLATRLGGQPLVV